MILGHDSRIDLFFGKNTFFTSLSCSLGGRELVQRLLLCRAAAAAASSQQPAPDAPEPGGGTGAHRHAAGPARPARPDQAEPLQTGQRPAPGPHVYYTDVTFRCFHSLESVVQSSAKTLHSLSPALYSDQVLDLRSFISPSDRLITRVIKRLLSGPRGSGMICHRASRPTNDIF